VIGNRFGQGDGSTSFHLPDLRGRFLRGRDAGAGRDPDRNARTTMNAGGAVGDLVGSVQGDEMRSHSHGYNDIYYSENGGNGSIFTNGKGSGDSDNDNEPYEISRTSNATGGNETRPQNAYVNYIIKF
jgi:microcystin-dependent protein